MNNTDRTALKKTDIQISEIPKIPMNEYWIEFTAIYTKEYKPTHFFDTRKMLVEAESGSVAFKVLEMKMREEYKYWVKNEIQDIKKL